MAASSTRRAVAVRGGVVVVVLALLALLPNVARAQPAPGQAQMPGIVAVGFGEATAPASAAHLQFQIMPAFFGGPGLPGLTTEQIDPIVQALVAAGAAEEGIEVTVPAVNNAFGGPGAPDTAEIRVTVEQPDADGLTSLVDAVRTAVDDADLDLFHVGVRYDAENCEALVQEARATAVADAEARAEGLAEAVGATLGDLIQASEVPYFGPTSIGSCAGEGVPEDVFGYGPFGPGSDPPFDAASAAEAEVYVQVTLTYAFEPAA